MSHHLPPKLDLRQLKNRAKDILIGHRQGDASACDILRRLRRFRTASDSDILAADLALHETQFALALNYGFSSWDALAQHVKRSQTHQPAKIMRQDGRVWLDGIPKLVWRKSGECTFAGALAATLSVTKHPFTYSQLMGSTGLAFRFRWFRRTDAPDWCPSSPVGEFPDELTTVQEVTGWRFNSVDRYHATPEQMKRVPHDVTESIDRGMPVIGHPEDYDVAVLYGYERRGGEVYYLWNGYNWKEPKLLHHSKAPRMIMILREHVEPMDAAAAFRQALTTQNWRRKTLVPKAEAYEGWKAGYQYGDDGLKTWIDDISSADSLTAEQAEKLFFVGWWCFDALWDARRQAATYLHDNRRLLSESAQPSLEKASEIYGRTAKLLDEALGSREVFLGPWTGKNIDDWTETVRKREIEILSEVRNLDRHAVRHLDEALVQADIAVS